MPWLPKYFVRKASTRVQDCEAGNSRDPRQRWRYHLVTSVISLIVSV